MERDERRIALRTPPLHETWANKVVNFSIVFIAAVTLALVSTAIYPFNPISALSISIVSEHPQAGQPLVVAVDYCKERDWVPAEVRWSLINEIMVVLDVHTASLPVGCHVTRLALPISRHVIGGTYQLQEELIYRPWPWRTFTYVRQTKPFTLAAATNILIGGGPDQ